MANKPINFAEIEQEWQMTNPEGKALLPTIQHIIKQCIANNPNKLQLIDRLKADHQEQKHKLRNRVSPRLYTPHTRTRTPQSNGIKAQSYTNKYKVLYNEEVDNNEEPMTEEPLPTQDTKEIKMPAPIFNDEWEQIDDFIQQNE